MAVYSEDLLKSFRLIFPLSRGNRRLITLYILFFSLLLIISYLGGLVIRGVNAFIMADHLNRFFNGFPSLIRVASRLIRPLTRPRSGPSLSVS